MSTEKLETMDIHVLTYEDKDVPGQEIQQFVGAGKEVHIKVNLNDMIPSATRSEVLNAYFSMVLAVIRCYADYSLNLDASGKKFVPPTMIGKIFESLKTIILNDAANYKNYANSRGPKYRYIQFKQMNLDESFDVRRHLAIQVRSCAR